MIKINDFFYAILFCLLIAKHVLAGEPTGGYLSRYSKAVNKMDREIESRISSNEQTGKITSTELDTIKNEVFADVKKAYSKDMSQMYQSLLKTLNSAQKELSSNTNEVGAQGLSGRKNPSDATRGLASNSELKKNGALIGGGTPPTSRGSSSRVISAASGSTTIEPGGAETIVFSKGNPSALTDVDFGSTSSVEEVSFQK